MSNSTTKKNSTLDYAQKVTDTEAGTNTATDHSTGKSTSVNKRNLVSESVGSVVKDESSSRVVNSKTTVAKASNERANRAFTISFSIPLTGIIPTGQGTNC